MTEIFYIFSSTKIKNEKQHVEVPAPFEELTFCVISDIIKTMEKERLSRAAGAAR